MTDTPYVLAGYDLAPFVTAWLAALEAGEGVMNKLRDDAEAATDSDSRYLFNASFLFANVGPRAAEPEASPEELLLSAVLGVYQRDCELFRGMTWTTAEDHVRRAFDHAQALGEAALARKLVRDVIGSGEPASASWERLRKSWADRDPAGTAEHDRMMADLDQRELRAAAILAPDLDFDAELLRPAD